MTDLSAPSPPPWRSPARHWSSTEAESRPDVIYGPADAGFVDQDTGDRHQGRSPQGAVSEQRPRRLDPVEDVDEACGQGRDPEADHVRRAEVDDHAALDEPLAEGARVRVGQCDVGAATGWVARGGDRHPEL